MHTVLPKVLLAVGIAVVASGCKSWVDLDSPRRYPCSFDAGEQPELASGQCPEGWRCGREGYCHSTEIAADYLCQADQDCEEGWRCGLDGRCANAAGDALRLADLSSPLVTRSFV